MKIRHVDLISLSLVFASASFAQSTNSNPAARATNGTPRPATVHRVGPVHPGFNPALPTLWLIGDSTVKNSWDKGDGGLWGWGHPIASWFDTNQINVENQALGGTSSRSFITTKLWDAVLPQIKPGDFLILQFGHNDNTLAKGSIKGAGEETQLVTNIVSHQVDLVHTYGWYMRQYIKDTKSKGGIPMVCSLIPRNNWTDGKVRRADDSYGKWARESAQAGGAFFIDLNHIIADHYDKLGEEAVKPLFPSETTHTGWDGAVLNAECVIEGIKSLKDCPLNRYLLANPEPPKRPTP